jgi:coproporphyrinogen III oxidase-like Fe-S oxidoreductase
MNERIRELAEQAGVDAGQTIANTICGVCGDDEWVALGNEFNKLSQKTRDLIYKTLEQNQEKFAELIVRECLDIASEVRGEPATDTHYVIGYDRACEKMISGIREHFGVDESKCQAAIDAARKEKT